MFILAWLLRFIFMKAVWPLLVVLLGLTILVLGLYALAYGTAAVVIVAACIWARNRIALAIRRHHSRPPALVAEDQAKARCAMADVANDFARAAVPYCEAVFRTRVDSELTRRVQAGKPVPSREQVRAQLAEVPFEETCRNIIAKKQKWAHTPPALPMEYELDVPTRAWELEAQRWLRKAVDSDQSLGSIRSSVGKLFKNAAEDLSLTPLQHDWTSAMTQLGDEYLDLYVGLRRLERELQSLVPKAEERARLRADAEASVILQVPQLLAAREPAQA